jgi:hypothetical protein
VELRNALAEAPDLEIVWVMAKRQLNARSLRFVDDRAAQPHPLGGPTAAPSTRSAAPPEPIEEGVPHPTTLLLDRDGIVRFADVREDFRIWLDPALLSEALAKLE